jgi:solute carrier family 35 protein E3
MDWQSAPACTQALATPCPCPFHSAIVFANKAVFQFFAFKFVFALTLIHTVRLDPFNRSTVKTSMITHLLLNAQVFTFVGMLALAALGVFTPKALNALQLAPLALGYVGYIVLCNMSLNLNSVGFYQIMKVLLFWG